MRLRWQVIILVICGQYSGLIDRGIRLPGLGWSMQEWEGNGKGKKVPAGTGRGENCNAFFITPPLSGSPNCIILAILSFVRKWP